MIYLLTAILISNAEIKGDITRYINVNPINKNKLPTGDSFIVIASQIPTPNIKIGIMNGMINIGSKIFPLFAPKVRAEPIIPISEIERPPINILIKSHGMNFRLMFNKIMKNGKQIINGIMIINQQAMVLDKRINSSGIGLVIV